MHYPLRCRNIIWFPNTIAWVPHPRRVVVFAARVGQQIPANSSQLANDVLSRAMNGQERAAFEALGLARRRRFEGLAMPAEPGFNDAVAAQALVHSAGDRLDLRQLGHPFIVRESVSGIGGCCYAPVYFFLRSPRIRLASKLTTFHAPCLSFT